MDANEDQRQAALTAAPQVEHALQLIAAIGVLVEPVEKARYHGMTGLHGLSYDAVQ